MFDVTNMHSFENLDVWFNAIKMVDGMDACNLSDVDLARHVDTSNTHAGMKHHHRNTDIQHTNLTLQESFDSSKD